MRTFRLDRISRSVILAGTFVVPNGFDPATQVLSGIAQTPYRHEVSLRVHGPAERVQARFPTGIVTVHDTADDGWVRVQMRAERLDWVPGVIAGLNFPFVIERPDALRDLVRSLAQQLADATGVDTTPVDKLAAGSPIANPD